MAENETLTVVADAPAKPKKSVARKHPLAEARGQLEQTLAKRRLTKAQAIKNAIAYAKKNELEEREKNGRNFLGRFTNRTFQITRGSKKFLMGVAEFARANGILYGNAEDSTGKMQFARKGDMIRAFQALGVPYVNVKEAEKAAKRRKRQKSQKKVVAAPAAESSE